MKTRDINIRSLTLFLLLRLLGISRLVLLTMLATSGLRAAVPVIEPTPQAEVDGLSLLKPVEATVIRGGLKFRLLSDDALLGAFDQRNPARDEPLDAILAVDQKGFVRTINKCSLTASPEINIVKIECFFWESSEGDGHVTPVFRVKWTLSVPPSGTEKTLEAFSFGLTYSGWTWSSEKRRALRTRGAAAAYQAATYKLAVALQKLMAAE